MISVTSAELNAWLSAFLWPLARILALVASAPGLGNPSVPVRVRIGLGALIALAVAPTLPALPPVELGSPAGLLILAQQILIGIAMGFAMRVVFAAVQMAGELAGLQMGFGFATLYDPQNAGQIPVLGQFLELVATLLLFALNGHLVMIATVTESFRILPIGGLPSAGLSIKTLVEWGGYVFSAGVLLSLPIIAVLLITNLALGVLARAAPQLNLFAVGFPVTLLLGMIALGLTLPYLTPVLDRALQEGLEVMLRVLR